MQKISSLFGYSFTQCETTTEPTVKAVIDKVVVIYFDTAPSPFIGGMTAMVTAHCVETAPTALCAFFLAWN
jgi:hypothetical protein